MTLNTDVCCVTAAHSILAPPRRIFPGTEVLYNDWGPLSEWFSEEINPRQNSKLDGQAGGFILHKNNYKWEQENTPELCPERRRLSPFTKQEVPVHKCKKFS